MFDDLFPHFSIVGEHFDRRRLFAGCVILVLLLVIAMNIYVIEAPQQFPLGQIITIEEGDSLSQAAEKLADENVVRSPFLLKNLVIALKGDGGIVAGDYFFGRAPTVFSVAWRVTNGEYGLDPVRITIPEGVTTKRMAAIFAERLPRFDAGVFLRYAQEKEGYLFPDTYFFPPNVSERQVVGVLEDTFMKNIEPLGDEFADSGRSLEEVVIMASILEKEESDFEDRRIISGILWKRIEIGMPLQVDATLDYAFGRNTYELTQEDLETDSPYNTYVRRGLPEGPIGNPGLEAIKAALYPEETEYLYYLADRRGTTYYARDFEGHKRNRVRYLN